MFSLEEEAAHFGKGSLMEGWHKLNSFASSSFQVCTTAFHQTQSLDVGELVVMSFVPEVMRQADASCCRCINRGISQDLVVGIVNPFL